jgi:hypothetical protein
MSALVCGILSPEFESQRELVPKSICRDIDLQSWKIDNTRFGTFNSTVQASPLSLHQAITKNNTAHNTNTVYHLKLIISLIEY